MNLFRPTSIKRALFFVLGDLLLSLFTLYFAYALRFNFSIPSVYLDSFFFAFVCIFVLKIMFFYIFRLYFFVWRFFGFHEAKNMAKAHAATYALFVIIYLMFSDIFTPFPRSVIVIDLLLSMMFLTGLRASKRIMLESKHPIGTKPALILGANSKASMIIQSSMRGDMDYYPVAIVSFVGEEMSKNSYLNNVRVHESNDMEDVIGRHDITSAIITQQLPTDHLGALVERLNKVGINDIKQVKMLGSKNDKLEDLSIEDLLARQPKDLDLEQIKKFIENKRVMVTGAGGSIGSEIARQCHRFGASHLILVDSGEYNLYQIGEQINDASLKLIDITDGIRLEQVFKDADADIVIHAAAYKHVPLCEDNPSSAVHNNIMGSKNVIDLSIKYDLDRVVIISTDKAVRPTNIMGATKRVIELYAANVDSRDTDIVAVRFGNVLGSSGSVIPKFKKQIEDGGPVTVTHPEITRYFMLIPEACQLVLQAAAIAKGRELFVLDMGEPIKIIDLARQMIRLYGKEDTVDIRITSLRPGEKLYEELLIDENDKQTAYSSIFIARPTKYDISQLNHDIEVLLDSDDKAAVLQIIVPEFTHVKHNI